jgi:ABC-2 type transport system ATP-binding protein
MSDAIRLERLGKVYVKRRSLREMALRPFAHAERVVGLVDVSLAIPRGAIFGLLGPNGAGKTTLLKILACLILPTEGNALVEGHSVTGDDRPVRRAIGFVTADERSFYWRLSGEENLIFFARLYGLAPGSAARRVRGLLADMELGEVAGRQFMSYSSGMKQRLAICRALLHDPPILCLDEPTRSLDPIAAKHLRRFIVRRLHQEGGKTIVLATHNLHEAEEMCDSLAVLDRGRVARAGRLEELTARPGGRDHYTLLVAGGSPPPADPRWVTTIDRRADGAFQVDAAIDRGGAALSDLLRALLSAGGTIVSCQRREPGLQDLFDLMDGAGEPRDAGGAR